MGPIGAQEMIFIFVLALLLFGPKKLPELGRMLGKGLTEFRRAKNELKTTFESHMQELERETRQEEQAKKATESSSPAPYSSATYPYPYDEYGRDSNTEPTHTEAQPAPEAEAVPERVAGTVPRSKTGSQPETVGVTSEEIRPA